MTCRRRLFLTRKPGELLSHVQNTFHQHNLPVPAGTLLTRKNRTGVAERFTDPIVRKTVQADLQLIATYHELIQDLEKTVERQAPATRSRTRSFCSRQSMAWAGSSASPFPTRSSACITASEWRCGARLGCTHARGSRTVGARSNDSDLMRSCGSLRDPLELPACLKMHVDALIRPGIIADDSRQHLIVGETRQVVARQHRGVHRWLERAA